MIEQKENAEANRPARPSDLPPGSPEAVAMSCRCPVLDNGHGRGYMGQPGVFVMQADCPLHGLETHRAEIAKAQEGGAK